MFFFFKQKSAYELRISDWSSDVCSSDLLLRSGQYGHVEWSLEQRAIFDHLGDGCPGRVDGVGDRFDLLLQSLALGGDGVEMRKLRLEMGLEACGFEWLVANRAGLVVIKLECARSEEHTSELQSLMRISYAVFCLKKKHTSQQRQCRYM